MATSPSASVDVLSPAERSTVVRGLTLLEASLRRSAKAAPSEELRAIYERDAASVAALSVRFR